MIIKANQRGNAKELALHLLNGHNNEHVTVHDVRGFVSETVEGALQEAYAISKGTRCRQFLFSLSLNPPDDVDVPIDVFEDAIAQIEHKLGLLDQPRIIVFHEKKGRRHCHVIWSRIKHETMTALNLSFFKYKLMDISKALFIKHNWKLPKGFLSKKDKDQTSYTQDEWQQAMRMKDQPDKLKSFFKSCWDRSDNKTSFAAALQEYGFYLARGDRRGYVVIDFTGEVYSLSRWLNIKAKGLKAKLGKRHDLPDLNQAQSYLKDRYTNTIKHKLDHLHKQAKEARAPILLELRTLVTQQRAERNKLLKKQQARWQHEHQMRSSRINHGIAGILDKVSGRYQDIRKQNEAETKICLKRDQDEQHRLIQRHLSESKALHQQLSFYQDQYYQDIQRIKKEVAAYINFKIEPPIPAKQTITTNIQEQIKIIEQKLSVLSGDILSLESSMNSHLISDDLKAQIKVMIERAKEMLWLKKKQEDIEITEIQEKRQMTEATFIARQREFYRLLEQREKLKAQEQQQKHNAAFYTVVMHMSYSLNGNPLYEIAMPKPERFEETLHHHTQTLTHMNARQLHQQAKTPSIAKDSNNAALSLSKGASTAKELLKRSGKLKPTTLTPNPAMITTRVRVKNSHITDVNV